VKKNLSDIYQDINGSDKLAETLRSLRSAWRTQRAKLDTKLKEQYEGRTLLAISLIREEAIKELTEEFGSNAALILMTDHDITELIDDMPENVSPAFPIAANKYQQ
jgi:hypothetical protein